MHLSSLPHMHHMPQLSHSSSFAHLNIQWGIQVIKFPYKICGVIFTKCDNDYLSFPLPLYEEKEGFISGICYIPLWKELWNLTGYNSVSDSETVV
jgi:hypothetical protein